MGLGCPQNPFGRGSEEKNSHWGSKHAEENIWIKERGSNEKALKTA
jgi:hypothetical protein